MKKNFSSIKRHTAAAAAAICIAAGAFGLPAHAGEVAFVDVSQVIAQSNPGKTAQKRVDELRAKLNKELENYAKTEKDKGKVEIRQLELYTYIYYRTYTCNKPYRRKTQESNRHVAQNKQKRRNRGCIKKQRYFR